jgi:hypothetical protein
MLDTMTPPV